MLPYIRADERVFMAVTTRQQWGYGLPDQTHAPAPAVAAAPARRVPRLRDLRGDLMGGATAALLTIPVSMGYGLLALSPLGESYVAMAVLAGLYAPVVGCLIAVLLGANTTMIYAPRSIVTFLIGAIVLNGLVNSTVPALKGASPAALLVLCFLLVFLSGSLPGAPRARPLRRSGEVHTRARHRGFSERGGRCSYSAPS
jgi:MFS superfamily sulfate permease-like transporter